MHIPARTRRSVRAAASRVALAVALTVTWALLGLAVSGIAPAHSAPAPGPTGAAGSPSATAGGSGLPQGCHPAAAPPNDHPLWQQQRLQFDRAWPFSMGQGVLVAVVDTGVDTDNPQLADGSIVTGGVDLVHDNTHQPPWTVDCNGHGSFVAGIIAARPTGGTRFVGVAPRSTILAVRYSPGGNVEAPIADLATGIRWAVDAGAKVINVSSEASTPYPKLRAAVDYARQHDVVVVAAAGNHRGDGNPITYPAAFPGVIAVGAIGEGDKLASFSDTAVAVSVVAPGENVVSTAARSGHVTSSGTSFAAPFVSGVAALVRAAHPDLRSAQVKHRIEVTADHVGGDLPDRMYGWGVVNPYQAVTAILPEEHGPRPTRPAAAALPPVHLPPPPDHSMRDLAVGVAGGGFGAVLLILVTVATVRRGRRRGWRPGPA